MLCAATAITAGAKVTLPNYITDNMIVQQTSILTVNGTAAPGSQVKVTAGWSEKPETVKAGADGRFSVRLATPEAGGPYSIVFEDSDGLLRIENVLSGEVWLCSGQSNMEFPVQGWTTVMDYDREVATAFHPDIRLLQVRTTTAYTPREDVEVNGGGWQICSSASMADFSAIAYFFARELNEKLKVPVGVIDTTWGGTPAEAWTSAEALGAVAGFEGELSALKEAGDDVDKLEAIYQRQMADWLKLDTEGLPTFDKAVMQRGGKWAPIDVPGYIERSALPGFDGIVWLQHLINVPADKARLPLELKFAAIDDEDETYFNGLLVGKGSGFDTPRSYTVPGGAVKAGDNVITIRVSDFGGEGGIAPGEAVAIADGLSIPLGGTWQYAVQSDFSKLPPKPASPGSSSYPSVLYNAMLSPLRNMPVKGVLWYQGCANVGRDEQYEPLFKALITDWRKLWGDDLPFYFVQLAGFLQPQAVQPDSEWAALRNAQSKALQLNNTAMAVAIDLGNPADIHPKDKQDVAHRLALIALSRDYGTGCEYAAPQCVSATPDGDAMVLTFSGPVVPTSKAITGFIIAGADGQFTTATPEQTDSRTLRLKAPWVKNPVAARYDWADFPCGNLYSEGGLPVAPFATDK
ncbi:MAG: 9-O-acetylesterase [Duncaniella sp.]|nr:9-O-acetylesterase [Duncaniella sp.]